MKWKPYGVMVSTVGAARTSRHAGSNPATASQNQETHMIELGAMKTQGCGGASVMAIFLYYYSKQLAGRLAAFFLLDTKVLRTGRRELDTKVPRTERNTH